MLSMPAEGQGMSQTECIEQKTRNEQIHDEDNQGAHNECGYRSAAHALCPAFHAEAFITTHRGDDESEDNWLRESDTQAAENQHIHPLRHELSPTKVQYQLSTN